MHTFALAFGVIVLGSSLSAQEATAPSAPPKKAFASLGPLAFGPTGVLFGADSRAAEIAAMKVPPAQSAGLTPGFAMPSVDEKIAALLGIEAAMLRIVDVAVDPSTKLAYLAVARGLGADATPVLLRINGQSEIELLDADAHVIARTALTDAPQPSASPSSDKGKGRTNYQETITDLGFADDKVIVAGLSNAEFSSCLRMLPYPFGDAAPGAGIEIYHGAHGKLETRSPVRTFLAHQIGGEPHIVAAYTCTPLVVIPVKQLTPGAKVRGKTIAELGNRNRPLDMVDYSKDGAAFFLMANSSRGVMKIPAQNLDQWAAIEARVDDGNTEGLPYETIEGLVGVEQLDKLDEQHGIILVRDAENHLSLRVIAFP